MTLFTIAFFSFLLGISLALFLFLRHPLPPSLDKQIKAKRLISKLSKTKETVGAVVKEISNPVQFLSPSQKLANQKFLKTFNDKL